MKSTLLLTVLFCCLFSLPVIAQTKPATKFKPPKLTSMLGEFKDSVSITKETAAQIIGLPLRIFDAAKKPYKVANYQLTYKKAGFREDEVTGKLIPTTTLSYQLFTETPVSPIWVKTIQEQIKSGDELYFFEIVAKDDQGRIMYSSNLKFTIK
ncbi:MAG TPA: hypothetical protein PLN30_12005 [Ferruginibacter sp.]|nr:hypothetical protein [Ferruginibacter sp.]